MVFDCSVFLSRRVVGWEAAARRRNHAESSSLSDASHSRVHLYNKRF